MGGARIDEAKKREALDLYNRKVPVLEITKQTSIKPSAFYYILKVAREKGMVPVGASSVANRSRKMTPAIAHQIRELHEMGVSIPDIAQQIPVKLSTSSIYYFLKKGTAKVQVKKVQSVTERSVPEFIVSMKALQDSFLSAAAEIDSIIKSAEGLVAIEHLIKNTEQLRQRLENANKEKERMMARLNQSAQSLVKPEHLVTFGEKGLS